MSLQAQAIQTARAQLQAAEDKDEAAWDLFPLDLENRKSILEKNKNEYRGLELNALAPHRQAR